jgi:hypothetical protein
MMPVSMIALKPRMPDLADHMSTEEAALKLGFHVNSISRMARDGK